MPKSVTGICADKRKDVGGARRRLLRWYDRGRRDLPWRRTADPYRIWVSEIMLQQTRVAAVVPCYAKFLRLFPSLKHLARANEDRVLAAWGELGYYSRARNLHRAAKLIQARHGGKFPREEQAALALPGVGRYTAAAILSIAYGEPLAVLDGNVARVLSRLHTIKANVRDTTGRKALWNFAREFLDTRRAGDFNQALMELGATICLPGRPRCETCPLRNHCRARRENVVGQFPPPRDQVREKSLKLIGAVVRDRAGRYLLERRPADSSWLAGFWEFPIWRSTEQAAEYNHADSAMKERVKLLRPLGKVLHNITRFRIEVDLWEAVLSDNRKAASETKQRQWADLAAIQRLPATTITRKALSLIRAVGEGKK